MIYHLIVLPTTILTLPFLSPAILPAFLYTPIPMFSCPPFKGVHLCGYTLVARIYYLDLLGFYLHSPYISPLLHLSLSPGPS